MEYLFPLFLLTSLSYSSVGLAGGSMYLAIMALAGMGAAVMAPLALGLNTIVALIGWKNFSMRHGFRRDLFVPLVIASVPAAFVGGFFKIGSFPYLLLLAMVLLASSVAMVFPMRERGNSKTSLVFIILIGGVVGMAAGITGIGGGLFLTPVLLFLGLAKEKEAASLSGAFIALNSLSGLAGHVLRGNTGFIQLLPPLSVAVIAGGLAGSYIGSAKMPPKGMRIVFGAILASVGANTLWRVYAIL